MQRSPLPLVEWLNSLPPNTQRAYRAAWEDLLHFTGKSLAELTVEDTARWLRDLAQRSVVRGPPRQARLASSRLC